MEFTHDELYGFYNQVCIFVPSLLFFLYLCSVYIYSKDCLLSPSGHNATVLKY